MQKRYARLRVSLNIADLADDITRGHDEERNGEVIPGWFKITTQNSKAEGNRKLDRFRDYVGAESFSSFSFSFASTGFFLIAEIPNLLSEGIIKRTMSSPWRTMEPSTYSTNRALAVSNIGPTRETLSSNECVTSLLESVSTFAYRCPGPSPPFVSSRRCGIFSSFSWAIEHSLSHTESLLNGHHEIREYALRFLDLWKSILQ